MDLTTSDLIEAVRKMRDLQKRYFQTRSKTVLAEARDAERRVDAMIAAVSATYAKQMNLL